MRRIMIFLLIVAGTVFIIMRLPKPKPKPVEKAGPVSLTPADTLFEEALALKESNPSQALKQFESIAAEYPQTAQAYAAFLEISDIYRSQGRLLDAKAALKKLPASSPPDDLFRAAEEKLWDTNTALMFSSIETPDTLWYEVRPGDTLYRIAKKHDTTVELIMSSNNLSSALIKPGMKLKTIKSIFKIEVSKSENVLTLKTDGELVKKYPVSTGADNSTPVGKFKIVNRIVNPVWYKTGAIVAPGSPENILGTRWLGLSEPGYGIHGTTDPASIGRSVTEGCVRMKNEDVEELFIIVPVGTEVIIKD